MPSLMEASGIFESRRNFHANVDVSSKVSDLLNGVIDDEDSFFDLVIRSDCGAINGGDEGASKKDFDFIESPRDVDFSNSDPISPVTPLRSSPNLKIFISGFKKPSRSVKTESNTEFKASPLHQLSKSSKISLKCSSAEELPVASVFVGGDNSLRSHMLESSDFQASCDVVSSGKLIPKYLRLIKPFYTKASKKVKVTVSLAPSSSQAAEPVNLSPGRLSDGSRIGSFKFVASKLVKSRSTSVAVRMPPLPPLRRRDDTLLEQHDGIQGAILHCKKSYGSSCEDRKRFSI